MLYEPRTMSSQVYQNLKALKESAPNAAVEKEQKAQAVEIYSYLSTWGLLRLKAEVPALNNQPNKQQVVECFFTTLSAIVSPNDPQQLQGENGLERLSNINELGISSYLGLTGVALQLAREFAFWAEAIYPKDPPAPTKTSQP